MDKIFTSMAICEACLDELPFYDNQGDDFFALFDYQTPIAGLISGLKFHNKLIIAKLFGRLLADRIQAAQPPLPEIIIPVPLHKKRLRQRGYNQALELAKPIAKQLNITIDKHSIKRIRHTKAQTSLPEKKRHQNIKGAFSIHKPIPYQHVAIVDDVVTTGSTVRELQTVLLNSGIKTISTWCCAKT